MPSGDELLYSIIEAKEEILNDVDDMLKDTSIVILLMNITLLDI